jgi:hypothetical protein
MRRAKLVIKSFHGKEKRQIKNVEPEKENATEIIRGNSHSHSFYMEIFVHLTFPIQENTVQVKTKPNDKKTQ